MNTFKERSNYLKAIALMSIFTFIFPGIEYLFVDMISLLVSENRVVLSQNYVLGMSYLGFILYPLYNRYFKGLSRKICIVISTTIIGLITIFYLHPIYPLTLIIGLVLFLFLGGLGGITSSTYWNKRYGSQKGSWGNLIDSFKENTKYVYSIYLKLNDKGYNENYYFDKNTKLIINGKTIDLPLESINVDELEGGTIWYSNVLEMTPELQNIKIETSQETKKNTKVKTGDHTKYMVYMGLIGSSLLGAYCIIMKNYIH
ncbi:hypothetical protein [Faecalibacillus intestinalis]|uniref:hypothetical protein n=1 Tax=Faecalibacillus intestinalis TaxID=1982626 RepID=UPI003FF0BC93